MRPVGTRGGASNQVRSMRSTTEHTEASLIGARFVRIADYRVHGVLLRTLDVAVNVAVNRRRRPAPARDYLAFERGCLVKW